MGWEGEETGYWESRRCEGRGGRKGKTRRTVRGGEGRGKGGGEGTAREEAHT